jgi:hypothetical protein
MKINLEKFKVIIWNSQQGFEGDRIVRTRTSLFFAEANVPGPAGGTDTPSKTNISIYENDL